MVPTLLHTINISDPVSAGGTKFKDCLKRITDERINRLKAYKDICSQRPYDRHDHPKPLNLIVVTDGEADEEEALENFLVDTANELEHLAAPANFIGFQFVQVGDSIEASAYLKRLDDDLHIAYQVWDIVDTTRYHYDDADEKERELDFVKVLLGAIDEGIDKMERRATNTAGDWDPN